MIEAPVEITVGGYFSLECGTGKGLPLFDLATGYQSARAAMAAVLDMAKPKTVWVPHYICAAVTEMLSSISVRTQGYALSDKRGVPNDLAMDPADWLICVDYFGISGAACDAAIARYGHQRVLVDASQSLFYCPKQGVTTVYSVRKFVGVPDGGLLVTATPPPPPAMANEAASIARSHHLLMRAALQITAGYVQFQGAEASLSDCEPQAISSLTKRMLAAIDFDRVRDRRIANYGFLAKELRHHGLAVPALPEDAVPLCCPVLDVDAFSYRRELAAKNIFTPTYWPDVTLPEDDRIGRALRDQTLYLPCDQRYGHVDMAHIMKSLLEIKESR